MFDFDELTLIEELLGDGPEARAVRVVKPGEPPNEELPEGYQPDEDDWDAYDHGGEA